MCAEVGCKKPIVSTWWNEEVVQAVKSKKKKKALLNELKINDVLKEEYVEIYKMII